VKLSQNSVRVTCLSSQQKTKLLTVTEWGSKVITVSEPWGRANTLPNQGQRKRLTRGIIFGVSAQLSEFEIVEETKALSARCLTVYTCSERVPNIKCTNLSAQHKAQQHNVITDNSKHLSDDPGETVRDHEIRLKPGSRHSKQSPHRINTEKSSLAAPTSAIVLLYHIVVCLLHILADLLKEIDRLEQQIAHNKRMF